MKILRILGIGLAAMVLLIGLALIVALSVAHTRVKRVYTLEVPSVAVAEDPATIERGRHLANTRGCVDCHGRDLGGNKVVDDPLAGKFYGPNLTSGKGGLPASYTDLDFVRAIRHGITREGRALLLMPSFEYSAFSDEDLGALIAFLKTVPSVDRERGPVSPGPLMRVLIAANQVKISAAEIDHQAKRPLRVTAAATAEYGAYLISSCIGCHGQNLAGGKIPGAPPDWPSSANLSTHADSRLSTWTEKDFFTAIRTQTRPDGSKLSPVMPAGFGGMNDLELTALWLYLKTLPPVASGKS